MKREHSKKGFNKKLACYALLLVLALVPFEAGAESEMVRADYRNILTAPPEANPPADQASSAVFFSGHVGGYAVPDSGNVPEVPSYNSKNNFLSESSFGQPLARMIPRADFIETVLNTAKGMLYYEHASGSDKDIAAFRYKTLLYDKETVGAETYIKAQFHKIGDYWPGANDSARVRASDAAKIIRDALRFAPWNTNLRWALLDIYYDIAVADLALAKEKMVEAFQASLGIIPAPEGEFLIKKEIELLEEALPLYQKALEGYFELLNDPMGVNADDMTGMGETDSDGIPFGYRLFEDEVPGRSLMSPLLKDAGGNWILSTEGTGTEFQVLSGYRDLILLFNIQRDYARAASELARRYVLQGASGDAEKAGNLIGKTQQSSYIQGQVLLGIFPNYADEADAYSGLSESVSGWRHELSELSHLRSYVEGETNLLGFTDDFLVLVQSVIPGSPESQYFDSYNYFAAYLNDPNAGGPLYRAVVDCNQAKADYVSFRYNEDQLAAQFDDKNEQYDERLRQIVGARPDEPGYDTPYENEGGEIALQWLNIEIAQKRIQSNQQEIEKIQEQIEIEIWRRGEEKGINDAIQQVYLDYGDEQKKLTEEIAEINADQTAANEMASATAGVSTSAGSYTSVFERTINIGHGAVGGGAIASSINAYYQDRKEKEGEKGHKQAAKEGLAARERTDIHVLQDDLLDINSKAQIKTWLLRMNTLAIESDEAALVLAQEWGRLSALLNEKEDLERRKAETKAEDNEKLAERYFADPSHRLLKDSSILRAELSFQRAQEWMFFAVRALEYKWNQKLEHYYETTKQTYSSDTLLKLRNATELEDMFGAMAEWDRTRAISGLNDDRYVKFSFREDFLGYRNGSQYFDPMSGESVEPWKAFQTYLAQDALYLDGNDDENKLNVRALRLTFNTVTAKEAFGFFSRNNWLDKIDYMRIKVIGGFGSGINSIVQGHLQYGGTSFIRNMKEGTPDPERPDRYIGEMSAYSTRYWFYESGEWQSKDALGASVSVQVSGDPDVPPSVRQIDVFKERSVATSEWVLYLPVEDENGSTVIDFSKVTDIEIHFYYYFYSRN